MTKKQKRLLGRILVGAVLYLTAAVADHIFLTGAPMWSKLLLYLIPYLAVGYDVLLSAAGNVVRGQVFDENFLMCIATVGALSIGFLPGGQAEFSEAVFVMLFFQVGQLFESIAVGKSRRSIAALMDIRPDFAVVLRDGKEETVDPEEVEIGEIILVRPGERIPLDGTVLEGISTLDTASLTGESLPRDVSHGDEVISGCVNQNGVLKIRVEKIFGESTVSRVLELVENAAANKSKSEHFITKFAGYYTPAVVCAAVLLAILPPLLSGHFTAAFAPWLLRAMSFLVISCPCALVISVPLSFFGGIGGASRRGILIKGSCYMETLADVRTVAFDKTGTLTKGSFKVQTVYPVGVAREELLSLAAHGECYSSHPVAAAIKEAFGKEADGGRVRDVREEAGCGVSVLLDGARVVTLGNEKWMCRLGVETLKCDAPGTVVHVAEDGIYRGYIVITDEIKEGSAEALQALKELGVAHTVMLTGDREEVAVSIGEALGVDEIAAELLPQDKVSRVEELLEQDARGKVAFVGDGINDAPVLSRADVGIAMGALGSDAAVEAADVVLMDDDPRKIAEAIRISSETIKIVRQNVVFALGTKFLILLLSALGLLGEATMWLAVFADVGVSVIAVLNAMRTLR